MAWLLDYIIAKHLEFRYYRDQNTSSQYMASQYIEYFKLKIFEKEKVQEKTLILL
jgi:hypothetical protein